MQSVEINKKSGIVYAQQIIEMLQVNFTIIFLFCCVSGYITKEIKLLEYDVRNLITRRILWSKLKWYSTVWHKNFTLL